MIDSYMLKNLCNPAKKIQSVPSHKHRGSVSCVFLAHRIRKSELLRMG